METLNTISRNMDRLTNANIDWSLDGGAIWFTVMFVGFIVTVAFAASSEN